MSDAPEVMVGHYRDQERRRILDMEPGPMLDREVAVKVFKVDNPDPRWSPSTDIAAAWEVVEQMQNDCWDFTLTAHKFCRRTHEKFEAIFGTDFNVRASTAPEAICKAALLARLDGQD